MWEEKRSGERGLLEESAHRLGVPGLGFKWYPDVYANGCFVFQLPPVPLREVSGTGRRCCLRGSQLLGCCPWGVRHVGLHDSLQAASLLSPQDCDVLVLAAV